jgi:hypothetical protein
VEIGKTKFMKILSVIDDGAADRRKAGARSAQPAKLLHPSVNLVTTHRIGAENVIVVGFDA